MTSLRLLADDLTGALDTAAEFVPLTGVVPAFWHGAIPDVLPANAALDSGTRECPPPAAVGIVCGLSHHLMDGTIAFKKIDSLLRGATIAEVAACATGWRHCVLAPAFPYQGRITRGGRQYAKHIGGDWTAVSDDLLAMLSARPGRLDADLLPGITVFDATNDDDLLGVVATVRRCPDKVLWIGTGGLAQALAAGAAGGNPMPSVTTLPSPVLGLFGSDQPSIAAQLAACAPHALVLAHKDPDPAARIAARIAADGIALASFGLPANTPRAAAAGYIGAQLDRLTAILAPPGTLVAAGGETLRRLCQATGAAGLQVQGRLVPGVPCSRLQGGRWNGVTVISKSGAFGHPQLLRELLPVTPERRPS